MKSMEVKITNLAPFYALGVEHRGAYTGIGQAFGALCGLLAQNQIPLGRTVGIYYDDPSETPEAELRSFAGLAIDAPHEGTAEGLTQVSLVGGKYAVAKFVGEYSKLSEAWNWMMGPWLQESGEQADARDYFELYLHHDEANPAACITEICIPLK